MAVSLDSFRKNLNPEILKKAEKLKIRECDEEKPGYFVAFVSDAKQDYDVAITLNEKKEILDHQCDCQEASPICIHKTALILFLGSEKKKEKEKLVKKKKLSPVEELVFDLPEMVVRNWLASKLVKMKDLEFLFLQDFGEKKQEINSEDVEEVTLNAIHAILKNKKKRKLEPSEIPKILANMKKVHEPYLQFYLEKPEDPKRFEIFLELILALIRFDLYIRNRSKKIYDYSQYLFFKAEERINSFVSEEPWQQSINNLVEGLDHPSHFVKNLFRDMLIQMHENAEPERKKLLKKTLEHHIRFSN